MSLKIIITLKNSGKSIELFYNGEMTPEDVKPLDENKWFIRSGFELHPFRIPKVIILRSEEIAGVEISQSEDWTCESAKQFNESLT